MCPGHANRCREQPDAASRCFEPISAVRRHVEVTGMMRDLIGQVAEARNMLKNIESWKIIKESCHSAQR
jgi:hypothetical protein